MTVVMAGARRPEELDVWNLARELKLRVYRFVANIPRHRDVRYCEDIRSASRSGCDLIAEGFYRFNPKEFHRFLNDAKASLGEVRNQLLHARDERYISEEEWKEMTRIADRAIGAATNFQAYLRTQFNKRPRGKSSNRNPEPRTPNREP